MARELSTRYQPSEIEDRVYGFWVENGHFHAEPTDPGEPYTIVIPPPNVTSFLHMGHALNNTLQDAFIRFQRMRGRNALWMPGMDHAGIATQNVVERQLASEGKHRRDLGREQFIARVWQWKEQYGGLIGEQLRRLGCSCDWERERFTMDEGLSRAVRETFVRLYDKGLIYRGKYIVNWCPRCRTALSDIEVEHEEHEGHLWHIRYAFADDPQNGVIVATTRPETMLGDTAVAVHPEDERYCDMIGKTVMLPIIGREIPIIADEMVDREFGSGAVKVTPAHDPNDFAVAQRHNLPAVVVIDEDGNMTIDAGDRYEGMDRFECREALIEDLKERGDLLKIDVHDHSVGHCYRCHVVVEPYLSDQWYVKMKPLARKAVEVVKEGRVKFHPARWAEFYLSWVEEVRDWCISRQIWWGHQVPVWYCQECDEVIVARETPSTCHACGSPELVQDEDVLDTWFSSGLWPFSTLGWPDQTPELAEYYPTNTLVTDRGIIYFWVARMIMMGMEFMGEVPFHDVVIHGTILDDQGRKMSKSLGNGIDPIEIIEQYGADACRFSLMMLATEGQDLKLSESKFEMGRNFANKVWNAARFVLLNLPTTDEAKVEPAEACFEDRWILSRLQATTADATEYLEQYRTNEAARVVYDFFWHSYCDWYVEIVKQRLTPEADPEDRRRAKETLACVLDRSLRLLHPLTPFLTEELWQNLKEVASEASLSAASAMQGNALIRARWPEVEKEARDESVEGQMNLLQDVIRAVRSIRKEKGIADRSPISAVINCSDADTDRCFAQHAEFLKLMAGFGDLLHGVGVEKPKRCATAVVGTIELFVQLEGLIDVDNEIARLRKQQADLEGRIDNVRKTLGNESFLRNAPAEVVERQRSTCADLEAQFQAVSQNLADLT